MSSRAELIEMAKELNLNYEGLRIEELKEAVRKGADKRLNRKFHISADKLSLSLKRFLVLEYDYVIKDKDGKVIKV